MQNARIVTSGLVLRDTDTKEADKILTVLTPDLGKIALIARGARRKNSRIAAASQLLVYSELTIYKKGNWYMLDEASTIEMFRGVREDFVLLSLASYFAELTEAVSGEGEAGRELLSLTLNALYALGTLKKDPLQVKTAFELRLLAQAGFEPLCDGCAVCGVETPEEPVFDVVHGVVCCRECREAGGLAMPLSLGALAALLHILSCPPKRLYSFTLAMPQLQLLSNAAEAFTATQLERSFRTLNYYKSILPMQV